jgi:type VI protein secretion system component VasF
LLFYIGRWRVPAANGKKLEEMFREICTYLRAKRVSSAFRDRWKPPSVGRGLANSSVASQ